MIKMTDPQPRWMAHVRRFGVLLGAIGTTYQGTGLPFASVRGCAPRVRKGPPTGTTTWSPPV
jgi:hypothetical protein